jgi:hypothetical protein
MDALAGWPGYPRCVGVVLEARQPASCKKTLFDWEIWSHKFRGKRGGH